MTLSDTLGQAEQEVKKLDELDKLFWSVTTVIGIIDKPALLYWAAEQTAKAAVAMAKTLPARLEEDGEDNVIKQLRDARFRKTKGELSDTAFGTEVHKLCETYALTGTKPSIDIDLFGNDALNAQACLDRFDEWLDAFQPSYQATEVAVYSPRYGYAGTSDAFLTIDGVRFIVDYKSSRKSFGADGKPTKIYPETSLQLAGYRFAELAAVWRPRIHTQFRRRYYALSPAEQEMAVPVPEVDGGLGIKITPEHCTAYPIVCDEKVWRAFLFLIEVARFQFNDAAYVVGEPLLPSPKEQSPTTAPNKSHAPNASAANG